MVLFFIKDCNPFFTQQLHLKNLFEISQQRLKYTHSTITMSERILGALYFNKTYPGKISRFFKSQLI